MKIRGLRWWIVVLVFLAAVLNYVDRQTLSSLAPTIQADLKMDDREYANIVNLFLVAYTIAYLISGKLVDRLGTRTGTAVFVIWWSLANIVTAWAQGVRSMGTCRFMLGLGEAGIWPAASKAVSEWFPARERALAIGFYTMGATIGATVAPYIVIRLADFDYASRLPFIESVFQHGTGWRMAFLITGLIGFLWIIPWLAFYRKPRESKLLSASELELIEDGEAPPEEGAKGWSWGKVLTFRPVWLLLFGRLITDPVWYFYQFWFAKYLSADHGMSQGALTITWIVYAAAGVGSLAGGWLSGLLVKRGSNPVDARLWIMLGAACLMPVSPFIAKADDDDAHRSGRICLPRLADQHQRDRGGRRAEALRRHRFQRGCRRQYPRWHRNEHGRRCDGLRTFLQAGRFPGPRFQNPLRTADRSGAGQGLWTLVPCHGLPPSTRPAAPLDRRHPSSAPHTILILLC
jgi:ACS family hexuronate transporter-like MFS transporter